MLQKSLSTDNTVVKNNLMSIANLVEENSLTAFAQSLEEIGVMLENVNQNVIDLISTSFLSTPFTKKI